MDNSTTISTFCKTLATFCNHLQSSSTALKKSLETRPIPLESASSTFLECLNRRVSSASSDLNLLESMACGTVSFEELLGHCYQLYKKNQTDLVELQDHLKNYGYIPTDDEDDALEAETPSDVDADDGLSLYSRYCAPVSATVDSKSILGKLDDLIDEDESLSLQNLGLSDVCLATIASKSNDEIGNIASPRKPSNYTDGHLLRLEVPSPPRTRLLNMTLGDVAHDSESVVASKTMINISRNDYENLPSFMKSLASWEDMVVAVDKMNSTLNSKDKQECKLFYQEELGTLGLGSKLLTSEKDSVIWRREKVITRLYSARASSQVLVSVFQSCISEHTTHPHILIPTILLRKDCSIGCGSRSKSEMLSTNALTHEPIGC